MSRFDRSATAGRVQQRRAIGGTAVCACAAFFEEHADNGRIIDLHRCQQSRVTSLVAKLDVRFCSNEQPHRFDIARKHGEDQREAAIDREKIRLSVVLEQYAKGV